MTRCDLAGPGLQVIIKAMLSMPQQDGSYVRGHPALTQRKTDKMVDIYYQRQDSAGTRAHGQVRVIISQCAAMLS